MKLKKIKSVYSEQQVREYLNRVQFPGFEDEKSCLSTDLPAPNLLTLSLLMHHHLLTFPFENTSMHHESSHRVSINPQDTFRRFVTQRKGGYCMNHNTLMLNISRGLGFRGFSTQGRVFSPDEESRRNSVNVTEKANKPNFHWESWSHMVLLILLPNHLNPDYHSYYLVDVGFGGLGIQRPLLLSDRHEERGRSMGLHRLIREKFDSSSFGDEVAEEEEEQLKLDEESGKEVEENQMIWKMQSKDEGDENWKTHYCFILNECFQQDYECMNHWTSNAPSVIFSQTLMVSLNFLQPPSNSQPQLSNLHPSLYPYHPFSIGQYTLFKDKFSIKYHGKEIVSQDFRTERERIEILKNRFGLLGDIEIEEALKNIEGMRSELKLV